MERPRLIAFAALMCLIGLADAAQAGETDAPANMTPIDRGYGQGDACFGDKYEKDEDLETGNEQAVRETLKLLLGPGS